METRIEQVLERRSEETPPIPQGPFLTSSVGFKLCPRPLPTRAVMAIARSLALRRHQQVMKRRLLLLRSLSLSRDTECLYDYPG